jgi:hypothetical protein
MTFKNELVALRACPEAIEWVGDKTLSEAWQTCKRADWMLWLATNQEVDKKLLVQAACECAELADKYLDDETRQPARNAISTARAWCRNEATIKDVKQAYAAAAHADYAASAHAAFAAANAANAAAHAAYAASDAASNAAANAASAAANAAAHADYAASAAANAATAAEVARKQILTQCADIVRKWIVL